MKISRLNPYNPYLNSNAAETAMMAKTEIAGHTLTRQANKINNDRPVAEQKQKADMKVAENAAADSRSVVSRSERNFFIRMFPESAQQLENHVLFNRNGRVTTPAISKGMIVDGRV